MGWRRIAIDGGASSAVVAGVRAVRKVGEWAGSNGRCAREHWQRRTHAGGVAWVRDWGVKKGAFGACPAAGRGDLVRIRA